MEAVVFTEQELDESKKRIIQRAEDRLVTELTDQMRRSVTREVFLSLEKTASAKLKEMISTYITNEKIEDIISKSLQEKYKNYSGQSFIEDELKNAILRVTQAHADAVSKEISNLLYASLKNGFYQK